jgi:hypothetical protein
MTSRRDLKRRIRQRQEQTGERYTTARAHVLDAPPPAISVVELVDVDDRARAAGVAAPTRVTPGVARFADEVPRLHEQLRRILIGPTAGLAPMRRVVVDGSQESWTESGSTRTLIASVGAFLESLRAGLRGPGLGGRMVAFDAVLGGSTRTVVAQLLPRYRGPSLLLLSLFPEDGGGLLNDWLHGLGRGRVTLTP